MNTGPYTSIAIGEFRDLWVHTGTGCNLSCPFCHEGSKPGDTRLQAPGAAELAPILAEAAARGVRRFAFTGGEPLIHKQIREILLHALSLRPVLVLTNGTAPFIRRTHQLADLAAAAHPLSFRVSLDYPDEARHDAGRGLKNFRKALEGLRLLHAAGFVVGITRLSTAGEDAAQVATAFRQLLRRQHLPQELSVIALPELGLPNESAASCTYAPSSLSTQTDPACATSRMLLRRNGQLRFHACPLTDDATRFDTGASLEAALAARIVPDHSRCGQCRMRGVDYAGEQAQRWS